MARKIKVTKLNNKGDEMGKHTKSIGTPMSMEDYANSQFVDNNQSTDFNDSDFEGYMDDEIAYEYNDDKSYGDEPVELEQPNDGRVFRNDPNRLKRNRSDISQMILDKMHLAFDNIIEQYLLGQVDKEMAKKELINIENRGLSLLEDI